jgi:SulP family sulfate permease
MALLLGLACLAIVVLWPKSYRMETAPATRWAALKRRAAHVPGTIVALALATLATLALALPVETIGSRFGGIPQALPRFEWPDVSWATAKQLLIPTVTIALLGAIESLLCARVADNMTELPRHDPNQELMAQGVANMVTPLFGGIPATGTIARTVTNVRAGATSPVSGMVHALTLLLIVLVAAPLAVHVPLAALAGILLFVAWNMGEWREFAHARRFKLPYRTILFGTFALTVVFDLTVAVEVGLILACLTFIWRMGRMFRVSERTALDGQAPPADGLQVFDLQGALFFGAVAQVESLPERVHTGTRCVVLSLHRLVLMDTSGLESLRQVHRALQRRGIGLRLAEAEEQPLSLIRRSGFAQDLGVDGLAPTVAQAMAMHDRDGP